MSERGFSLVEVMIAIVVLTVGVLGLAASAAQVTRMTGQGGRFSGSAAVAESRFEQLRADGCDDIADGSASTGKYSESWRVTSSGLLRVVTVTVTYNDVGRTRNDAFISTISCATEAS
jgi:prepilin-type N-terminal cleavage/methylation domain-containing protein